jgi:hypothetical protein
VNSMRMLGMLEPFEQDGFLAWSGQRRRALH